MTFYHCLTSQMLKLVTVWLLNAITKNFRIVGAEFFPGHVALLHCVLKKKSNSVIVHIFTK